MEKPSYPGKIFQKIVVKASGFFESVILSNNTINLFLFSFVYFFCFVCFLLIFCTQADDNYSKLTSRE
ncbi:hypothetical protein C5167_020465 [Papaver somniferum]|uniref:Uncharacterized protein n=1 Tax=Papaver somniferum TaxID=3469 RepID=A0A4Y7IT38_PAPSO|nr:hypothetical protein C5167_020465 [Papaver somniferum]